MENASFTKGEEFPDTATLEFSKINLFHGLISNLQKATENSVIK